MARSDASSGSEFLDVLKKIGLRATRQRLSLLKVVYDNPEIPMSIDELLSHLDDDFDRVTVYRIVECFTEKGLLEKVHHVSNSVKVVLSPNFIKGKHQHLVTCRICGSTYKASICLQPGWQDKLKGLGFKELSHNLTFSGVCANH